MSQLSRRVLQEQADGGVDFDGYELCDLLDSARSIIIDLANEVEATEKRLDSELQKFRLCACCHRPMTLPTECETCNGRTARDVNTMTDTEPAEPTQPSNRAPEQEEAKPTPAQSPESKRKSQAEAAELLRRTGERFARFVLDRARAASHPTGALLAARDAVKGKDADLAILMSAIAACMPIEWLDDVTATWLNGMTKGEAEASLAAFAAFWTLGNAQSKK